MDYYPDPRRNSRVKRRRRTEDSLDYWSSRYLQRTVQHRLPLYTVIIGWKDWYAIEDEGEEDAVQDLVRKRRKSFVDEKEHVQKFSQYGSDCTIIDKDAVSEQKECSGAPSLLSKCGHDCIMIDDDLAAEEEARTSRSDENKEFNIVGEGDTYINNKACATVDEDTVPDGKFNTGTCMAYTTINDDKNTEENNAYETTSNNTFFMITEENDHVCTCIENEACGEVPNMLPECNDKTCNKIKELPQLVDGTNRMMPAEMEVIPNPVKGFTEQETSERVEFEEKKRYPVEINVTADQQSSGRVKFEEPKGCPAPAIVEVLEEVKTEVIVNPEDCTSSLLLLQNAYQCDDTEQQESESLTPTSTDFQESKPHKINAGIFCNSCEDMFASAMEASKTANNTCSVGETVITISLVVDHGSEVTSPIKNSSRSEVTSPFKLHHGETGSGMDFESKEYHGPILDAN